MVAHHLGRRLEAMAVVVRFVLLGGNELEQWENGTEQ